MISDKATIISSGELQTTTLIHSALKSSETAPLKFVFSILGSSGFQMVFFGGCFEMGLPRYC